MYSLAIIKWGYLLNGDFPDWVGTDQRNLLKSRYKLISAFQKRSDLGPVQNVKSSVVYCYNHGKWGLDKWSEAAISVLPTRVFMEVKYTFCLLAGPLVNLWRVEQATNIVAPFIADYQSKHGPDSYPSLEQLRRQIATLKWDDFVFNFTCQALGELQKMGHQALLANYSPQSQRIIRTIGQTNRQLTREEEVTNTDAEIRSLIEAQVGKTSGMGAEDYAEQEEDGASA